VKINSTVVVISEQSTPAATAFDHHHLEGTNAMTEPKVVSFGSAKEGLRMPHHDAFTAGTAATLTNEGRRLREQFELGKCPD
jgi:hypothetical protein